MSKNIAIACYSYIDSIVIKQGCYDSIILELIRERNLVLGLI